jgi:hypothetical protein
MKNKFLIKLCCTVRCQVIVEAALKKAEMKSIEDVPFNMGTSVDSQVTLIVLFFSSMLFVFTNVLTVRLMISCCIAALLK